MYKTMAVKYAVFLDNPIFGEELTLVSIDDEAGGAFIVLEQENMYPKENGMSEIRLDLSELNTIKDLAEKMIDEYDKLKGE